jgi:hypothetical protein
MPKLLLHGIDTLQASYYLRPGSPGGIDFEGLALERERLRLAKDRHAEPVKMGDWEFMLAPHGSQNGYPLILRNADFQIEMGELMNPPMFVTFRSEALWRESAPGLHRKLLAWAEGLSCFPNHNEIISRVDFAFDFDLGEIDFDEDSFVTLSSKDSRYRESGRVQTFVFGKSDVVLRVYDKVAEIRQQSDKVWFYELWGQKENVWRVEWQVRKAMLKRFGIVTFADLHEYSGDLLRYLAEKHDSLRVPNGDSNRSRWPMHPLWESLLGTIRQYPGAGLYRNLDPTTALQERRLRDAIAVYGYLKHVAAIDRVRGQVDFISVKATLRELEGMIDYVHDPLSWRTDVDRRVKEIKLGQW